MNQKIKSSIIYIFVLLTICASFILPDLFLKMKKYDIQIAIAKTNSIDVETEKIYLVKAIHDMEKKISTVKISPNNEPVWEKINKTEEKEEMGFFKEMRKLQEYGVLGKAEILDSNDILMNTINRYYEFNKDKYIIHVTYAEDKKNLIGGEVEDKTGKLLYVVFKKEDIVEGKSIEEIMRNYVKYLDLYIIDDWKYEYRVLKSEKAQLIVSFDETLSSYILSIHSYEWANLINSNK